jgi:hypothetical protein
MQLRSIYGAVWHTGRLQAASLPGVGPVVPDVFNAPQHDDHAPLTVFPGNRIYINLDVV